LGKIENREKYIEPDWASGLVRFESILPGSSFWALRPTRKFTCAAVNKARPRHTAAQVRATNPLFQRSRRPNTNTTSRSASTARRRLLRSVPLPILPCPCAPSFAGHTKPRRPQHHPHSSRACVPPKHTQAGEAGAGKPGGTTEDHVKLRSTLKVRYASEF
jgi:hypothetical protein